MKLKRSKIPYDFIDKEIRKIVRLLNSFPFCATTLSCGGHPKEMGEMFVADCHIHLKTNDEDELMKLLSYIASGFKDEPGLWLHTSKQYHFSRDASIHKHSYSWRIGFFINGGASEEVRQMLCRGRKTLKRLIQEYKEIYKNGH